MIKTDLTNAQVNLADIELGKIKEAHAKIRTNKVEDSNVWVELPNLVTDSEIAEIQKMAKYIRENCDVMFVIGVGGSYAGAYAGMQWLCSNGECGGKCFPVEYLGISFDPATLKNILEKYKGKRICVNIVSKSGTTLEIISAFNAVAPYATHVVATTSADKGFVKEYATSRGVMSFKILDGVGGRYSALGAVGYLPLAVDGVDIKKMHEGARQAYKDLAVSDLQKNEAYKYAAARWLLHKRTGKNVEVLASFFDGLEGLGRWWQQLFGESEGKEGKGLFPVNLVYSRDLHSMGQYVQQGNPIYFETLIDIEKPSVDFALDVKQSEDMLRVPVASMAELNRAAFVGTVKAHTDAGVPVVLVKADRLDAAGMGYMFYFFEIACAMSAFLLGVNPFDQPGVEFYKKNMREELKK